MGASVSHEVKELSEFRKQNIDQNNVALPESPQNRVRTDSKWLYVLGGAVVILLPFVIYTLINSDIRRLQSESDDCGNLCGYENEKINGLPCSGESMINRKYTRIRVDDDTGDITSANCVESCEQGDFKLLKSCLVLDDENDRSNRYTRSVYYDESSSTEEMSSSLWRIIFTTLITIILSGLVILMYRYATAFLVWGILIFSLLIMFGITALLWYGSQTEGESKENQRAMLSGAITMTIVSVVLLVLVVYLFKKIHLVILLYKETTKAIFSMPLLILIPVITVFVEAIVILCFGVTTVFMLTAGRYIEVQPNIWRWEPNFVMDFTFIFNIIIAYWILQFIIGCQYMTISGAVSSWYFSRNKETLQSPIKNSFFTTMRFHLGSIALGSLVITITWIIKVILRSLAQNQKLRIFVSCCMEYIEYFVKFLSKNAYIVESIHGRPFFKSGKRAATLLLSNAKSLIAVNSIGDFVLGMAQFIIVVVSSGIARAIISNTPALIVAIVFNIIVVLIMFAVFETTIDTLFICFCEDKALNDGISKPYYMSRGLMQFVDKSNKIYQIPTIRVV